MRRALKRVIKKSAPSGDNNEQFRDCCIWDVALAMAADREVHLITGDTAFYEGRSKTAGWRFVIVHPRTRRQSPVHTAEAGVKSLDRGLEKAGVGAETFELKAPAVSPEAGALIYSGALLGNALLHCKLLP